MSARFTVLAVVATSFTVACGAPRSSATARTDAPSSSASALSASAAGDPLPRSSASASASPAPSTIAASAPVVPPPPPDPSIVTVTTVKIPASTTLDGDPSEWGALDGVPASGATSRRRGASQVAFALDPKTIHLVGSIDGEAKSGLIVALRFDGAEVPPIGYAQRGGGFQSIGDCTEEIEGRTPPIAECKAIHARYDAFRAAHAARFTRVFRVTETGISADGAALTKLVASGTFKSKPTATGFTFEADLPVAALPRTIYAAVSSIDLAAAPGTTPPAADAFLHASLAEPVAFEPYAAVRQYAYDIGRMGQVNSSVVSYQPGDWNKVEVVRNDDSGLSLEASERALYTKLGGEGDLEFGLIHFGRPMIIMVKAGVPSEQCWMRSAPTKAIKKNLGGVDGWLMVTSYNFFRSDMGYGYYAGFDTCFGTANGALRSGLWQEPQNVTWDKVTPTISSDYETLSLAGTAYPLDLGSKPTVTMRSAAHVWRLSKTGVGYVESP